MLAGKVQTVNMTKFLLENDKPNGRTAAKTDGATGTKNRLRSFLASMLKITNFL